MDLKKTRRSGFYFGEDGKPYVSVTEILNILSKPMLINWSAKQVFYAMVKNPDLKEEDALRAPRDIASAAAERGTAVHSLCEAFKNTGKIPNDVPDRYRGYARAFESWIREFDVQIVENERTVFSKLHNFAGTVDFIYRTGKSDKILVGDIKTGKSLYPEVWLQTSAYLHGLQENGIDASEVSALLLKEDGTYLFERGRDEFQAFLYAKYLWEWRNRELITSIGYQPTLDSYKS